MIGELISKISQFALDVISATGYWGIFILSVLESAAIPIPSEVVLPFSGFLVARGEFVLWEVVLIATLANLVGSVVLYWIGKSGGRWVLEKYGAYILITKEKLNLADSWFKKHGVKAVFWGRMLPVVRTFISLPPGITKMNFKKFVFYTFLGALPWNFALAYIGLKTGENWEVLHGYFQKFNIVIVAVVVIGILWFIFRKRK